MMIKSFMILKHFHQSISRILLDNILNHF